MVPRQLPDPCSGGAEVFFFVRLPAGRADLRGTPVLRLIPLDKFVRTLILRLSLASFAEFRL